VASWEVVDGLDVDARVRRHGDPAGLDRVVDTHAADMDDPGRIGAFLTTPQQNPRVNHVEMADLTESSLTERRTCVALLHALREWYCLAIDWKVTSRFLPIERA
jgi:hypothetical protein